MIDFSKDIDSLSNFKRQTGQFVRRMRATGNPVVLTVNGKAQLIVQDAAAYQQLLERVELAENVAVIRQGLEDVEKGRTESMREAIERLGKK